MDRKEVLANNLRELRDQKGYSLRDLEKEINIPYQTISNYENGKSVPPSDVLAIFAEFFKVSTDYLLGITSHRTTDPQIREVAEYLGLQDSTIQLLLTYKEPLMGEKYSKSYVIEEMLNDHDFLIVIDRCCASLNFLNAGFPMTNGEEDWCYRDAVSHVIQVIQEHFFDIDSSSRIQNLSKDGMLIYKKAKNLLLEK